MDEAALRREVLIPLFQAMGYSDVTGRHGTGELGKDIVMWSSDPLAMRINTGVVVKRGPISGRADGGHSSAATTATQIRQTLGADYRDPRTGQLVGISRVLVVASGSISEQAQSAILAQLTPVEQKAVSFIDGGKVASLIAQHLGTRKALEHAAAMRLALQKIASPHDIRVSASERDVAVAVGLRAGAEHVPIIGHINLGDADSPTASRSRELLERHVRTGAPATLEGVKLHIPQLVEVFEALGAESPETAKVQLGARRGAELTLVLRFREGAEEQAIGPILCQVTQAGTEEVTIESIRPARGWTLKCILGLPSRSLTITMQFSHAGLSAQAQYQAMLATELLARGPDLAIEEFERGVSIGRGKLTTGQFTAPERGLMQLADAAARIERRTNRILSLPGRDITFEEATTILEVAALLDGQVMEKSWENVKMTIGRVNESALEHFGTAGGAAMTVRETIEAQVFGQQIGLGVRETILYDAVVSSTDRQRLRMAARRPTTNVDVRLRPATSPGRLTMRLVEATPLDQATDRQEQNT